MEWRWDGLGWGGVEMEFHEHGWTGLFKFDACESPADMSPMLLQEFAPESLAFLVRRKAGESLMLHK